MAVLATFATLACSHEDRPDRFFSTEFARVKTATLPPDAGILGDLRLDRAASSRSAGWEIESKLTWEKYVASVEGLLAGYRRQEEHERAAAVSFTKRADGDSFSVSLEKLANGPPLKVRVTFVAAAD